MRIEAGTVKVVSMVMVEVRAAVVTMEVAMVVVVVVEVRAVVVTKEVATVATGMVVVVKAEKAEKTGVVARTEERGVEVMVMAVEAKEVAKVAAKAAGTVVEVTVEEHLAGTVGLKLSPVQYNLDHPIAQEARLLILHEPNSVHNKNKEEFRPPTDYPVNHPSAALLFQDRLCYLHSDGSCKNNLREIPRESARIQTKAAFQLGGPPNRIDNTQYQQVPGSNSDRKNLN